MTIQALVRPLGVSTKTVYRYFPAKEDLLNACLQIHYRELRRKLQVLMEEEQNPVLFLQRMFMDALELDFGVNHVFYHDLNYYYPQLQDRILKKLFAKNTTLLEEAIARGIDGGYFRKTLKPVFVVKMFNVMYTSITRTGEFRQAGRSVSDLFNHSIGAYLAGLCTAKGLRVLDSVSSK